MEEEFLSSRKTTQGDMVTYMEEDVYKALCELTSHRMRADARLKYCNEVSVGINLFDNLYFFGIVSSLTLLRNQAVWIIYMREQLC